MVCRASPHPPSTAAPLIGRLASTRPLFLSDSGSGGHRIETNRLPGFLVNLYFSPRLHLFFNLFSTFAFKQHLFLALKGQWRLLYSLQNKAGTQVCTGIPLSVSRRTGVLVQSKRSAQVRSTGTRRFKDTHPLRPARGSSWHRPPGHLWYCDPLL